MINVKLKDGSVKGYPEGITVLDIARDISPRLARAAMAGEVDGDVTDLRAQLDRDCSLDILTFDDKNGKKAFWHTSSHIMAQAVKRLFPEAKLAIGPSIDNGFYYDFDVERPFSTDDLDAIEQEMARIVKEDYKLERFELPRTEAIRLMEEMGEPYKVELINDLPEDAVISFYKQGEFVDLCAGPHIMSTGAVKAVKLLSVAGAYWRGSEKNKMLQRIYGVSYPKKSELDEYLAKLE
ncbi:MAG TPA: TGS domain-containing protein, partial [Candidatus Atribacteria bacterium]|nr:TGS domain-containing protein [Candidatus Atribacteria bacterium]